MGKEVGVWWEIDGSLLRKDGTYGVKSRTGKGVERGVRVKKEALEKWKDLVRNGTQVKIKSNPVKDQVLGVGDILDAHN